MKRVWLVVALVMVAVFGSASIAEADSTQYTYNVSGTYDSATASAPLSGPGQNFTLSFTVPAQPTNLDVVLTDDFFLNDPVSVAYSLGGVTSTLDAFLGFYNANAGSQKGGFFVDFCTDPTCLTGSEYQWTFAGPQQYIGSEANPTMVPSGFSFTGQPFTFYNNVDLSGLDSTISGNVNVVTTPEPSTMVMLLAGIAASAFLLKKRV